jgi:hypothetical protein
MDPTFEAANAAFQALNRLEGKDLEIAVGLLSQRLGMEVGAGANRQQGTGGPKQHGSRAGVGPSAKEFMKAKKPEKEIERVACLAYYLANHQDATEFNGKDITKLNTEARGPTFSNIGVHIQNASKAGYLTTVGGGKKGITSRGEAVVEALPDREAVKAALEAHPTRARRTRRKGKKAKGS